MTGRLFLFVLLVASAAAVRDVAFWTRLLTTIAPSSNAVCVALRFLFLPFFFPFRSWSQCEVHALVRQADFASLSRVLRCPFFAQGVVRQIATHFNSFIVRYNLNNDRRISNFLGQCAVESDHFKTTTEYASGAAYNGRRDLGNTQPGDGPRFKGRGLIQLTGRENYRRVGSILRQNFEGNPTIVAQFPWALEVSGVYWTTRRIQTLTGTTELRNPDGSWMMLNDAADRNDIRSVTRNVNGKRMLALARRIAITNRAYTLLQMDRVPGSDSGGDVPPPDVQVPSEPAPSNGRSAVGNILAGDAPKLFLAYMSNFNGLPHYSSGTVDLFPGASPFPRPLPGRRVTHYVDAQPQYGPLPTPDRLRPRPALPRRRG